MVRSKPTSSKKKPKGGLDFKKIKRKVGRKLPPPKNQTNTEIKSKAIVLPEQSIATERSGLAVNKKGLTLRELLQQTSHHNAKIRRVALNGIRDLLLKHPSELKRHKIFIIEKLRERICDNDKVVRETLYHLLKTTIFPSSKEDISGPVISLMMAYVFNAMTHIAIDIRLMAFKFFELIVLCFPSSFFLFAEKVLENYIDILRNNQIYLQEMSKLKSTLGGLVRCLSLLANKEEDQPSNDLEQLEHRCLHSYDTELQKDHSGMPYVAKKLDDLVPILVNSFHESVLLIRAMPVIEGLSFDCILCSLQNISLAVKIFVNEMSRPNRSRGLCMPLLSGGPDLSPHAMLVNLKKLWEAFPVGELHHSTEKEDERYFIWNVAIAEIFLHLIEWNNDPFLLEKFLQFFESCLLKQVSSSLPSAMTILEKQLVPFFPKLVVQVSDDWRIRLLEAFTNSFKSCKVESRHNLVYLSAIEEMLLPIDNGHIFSSSHQDTLNYQIAWVQEFPKFLLQLGDRHPSWSKAVLRLMLLTGQYSVPKSPLAIEYNHLQWALREFYGSGGPFNKLPTDCQELAICCLYYFSCLSSDLLESLACCCLCAGLEPCILFRIIEILHSAYKAGHVQLSDYIGFLVTLIARFKVFPEKFSFEGNDMKLSNQGIFQSLNSTVCSCLSQLGDKSLLLKLLYKIISREMLLKPPLENMRGLYRMMVMLDSGLVKLSEEDFIDLSNCLAHYLLKITYHLPETFDVTADSKWSHMLRYYIQPCVFLFCGSSKLLNDVLKLFESKILEDDCVFASHFDVDYVLSHASRILAVTWILIFMHDDTRWHRSLSSAKAAIKNVLMKICMLEGSQNFSLSVEERHKVKTAVGHLKTIACKFHYWEDNDLGA